MVGPRPRIPRWGRDRAPSAPQTESAAPEPDARGNQDARGPRAPRSRDAGESARGGSSTLSAPTPAHTFNGRLIALLVVATLILFLAAPTAKIYVDQRTQIAELEQSIARDRAEQQRLKHEEQLWSDEGYVEQQARERMFYVKPGERPFLVLGADAGARESAQSSAEQVEAGRPAWADGLWQSVVDSAFPVSEPTVAPAPVSTGDPQQPGSAGSAPAGQRPTPNPSASAPATTPTEGHAP